jgi:hypothetical protein
MDCQAVKLWRDRFKLNLSNSWKRDVEVTVTDLKLWKWILDNWYWIDDAGKRHSKHPGIKGLLTEYERLMNQRSEVRGQRLEKTERANFANAMSESDRIKAEEREWTRRMRAA